MKRILKYCEFYEDFGYSTIKVFQLREEIETLIIERVLEEICCWNERCLKACGKRVGKPWRRGAIQSKQGYLCRYDNKRSHYCWYFRKVNQNLWEEYFVGKEVNMTYASSPSIITYLVPIIFTEQDLDNAVYIYNHTLVITLKVATHKVTRILVDMRSSVDIIFKDTLDQLTLECI